MGISFIQYITNENFKKFGVVIERPMSCQEDFKVIVNETKNGWRLAVFHIHWRSTKVLEKHPTSMESFEPLNGTTILIVAEESSPDNYEVFLLDKPVCLNKGIWHQVLCLSDGSDVKITENFEVHSDFFNLQEEIKVVVEQFK